MMEPQAFQMLIAENIQFFVERIAINSSFQAIANSFLLSSNTSSKFGHVLVKFLMKKLPELASSSEKSTLYLKMFRLVFSAVSSVTTQQTSTDNENMLKVVFFDSLETRFLALSSRNRPRSRATGSAC